MTSSALYKSSPAACRLNLVGSFAQGLSLKIFNLAVIGERAFLFYFILDEEYRIPIVNYGFLSYFQQ